jgi:hypothetical protein
MSWRAYVLLVGIIPWSGCRSSGGGSPRSVKEPRGRAIAHLFGVPAAGRGTCRRGFSPVPGIDGICFRSCRTDGDCPAGADCRNVAGLDGTSLCQVR